MRNRSTSATAAAEEVRALLALGWPIVVGQLLHVGLSVADTVMVGRVGATELAVVGIGSSLATTVYLGALGLMLCISPLVAQCVGARDQHGVERVFRQALWYAAMVAAFSFIVTREVAAIAGWMSVAPEVLPGLTAYLEMLSWGMPAACLAMVPRFVADGSGHTKPMMIVLGLLLPANVFGNYVFVFGHFGAPEMGAVGAALSTALGYWLACIMLYGWIFVSRRFPGIVPATALERPHGERLLEMLKLGVPMSVSMLVETALFTAVSVLMGRIGAVALAAHQVAINYAALTFMVPVGLSLAVTVRVGHALGAGDAGAARFRGRVGIAVCGVFMALSALFILLQAERIVGWYTLDMRVAATAVELLMLAAWFQIFDGLQVGTIGVLRGYRDVRTPMLVTAAAYWCIGLPISWYAAFAADLGPGGLWLGLLAGLAVAAALLLLRFARVSRTASGVRTAYR